MADLLTGKGEEAPLPRIPARRVSGPGQDGHVTAVLDALRTADGERLAASLRRGPGSTCVVLAHGFSGSSAKPAVRRIVDRLAAHGWDPLPAAPVEGVAAVAPIPLLVVHGDRDGYFPVSHALALASAAREPVELWLEEGFAHAESGASPELVDRLGAHLPVLLGRRPS